MNLFPSFYHQIIYKYIINKNLSLKIVDFYRAVIITGHVMVWQCLTIVFMHWPRTLYMKSIFSWQVLQKFNPYRINLTIFAYNCFHWWNIIFFFQFSTIFQFYLGGQFHFCKTENSLTITAGNWQNFFTKSCIENTVLWMGGWVKVFDVTFNNISIIPWWSVLLMEETEENHWSQITDKLYHIMFNCCIEYSSPERDLNSQH